MTTVWMNKPQDRVSEFANPYMTKENKEIKNSVLLDLFCEHETARQNEIAPYNALHDVKLPDDTVVDKVRVNNTVYLNFKNDISANNKPVFCRMMLFRIIHRNPHRLPLSLEGGWDFYD